MIETNSTTSSSSWIPAGFLILGAMILMAVLAGPVLQAFPIAGDEYAYSYQARTFLAGRVVNPPAPDPSAFHQVHLISTPDRMFSKYPPGWPAVLALGEAVGLGWLVNPLLMGGVLFVAWILARRWAGDRVALALLALLATNPFLLMNGTGFYAHPWVGLLFLLMLLGLLRYHQGAGAWTAVGMGTALAGVILARPQELVFLAPTLAIAAGFALRGRQPGEAGRHLLAAMIPVLAAIAGYLAYNAATTGDPWVTGHLAMDAEDRPLFDPWTGLRLNANRILEYLEISWILLLVPLGFAVIPRPMRARWILPPLLAGLFVMAWTFYLFPDALPQFGPRYFFTTHSLLVFPAAWVLVRIVRARRLPAVLAGIGVLQLIQTGFIAYTAALTVEAATGPARAAAALTNADSRSVLVTLTGSAGSVPRHDLVRNDLTYQTPYQFVRADSLEDEWWGRAEGRYQWDGAGGPPVLVALGSPFEMIYALDSPVFLGDGVSEGWAVSTASNRCGKRAYRYPGSRSLDWMRFMSCGPVSLFRGAPPAPGGTWPDSGRKWFTRHYRTTLMIPEPGTYTLEVLADDEARVWIDGTEVLRARSDETHVPVAARVELESGPHALTLAYSNIRLPAELTWSMRGPDGHELSARSYQVPEGLEERP